MEGATATLLKVSLFHGCFSSFLNCTNGTKSRKASHILNTISKATQTKKTFQDFCHTFTCLLNILHNLEQHTLWKAIFTGSTVQLHSDLS